MKIIIDNFEIKEELNCEQMSASVYENNQQHSEITHEVTKG